MSDLRPTQDLAWATTDVSDGANSTVNKVEPSTQHKTTGFFYPEEPPRQYWNYWMEGMYDWTEYIGGWFDTDGVATSSFAQNLNTTTGLTFGVQAGSFQTGPDESVSIIASNNLLTANATSDFYIDLDTDLVAISESGVPSNDAGTVRLFTVVTDSTDITAITDHRSWATVGPKRATNVEVATGSDNSKYVTPSSLGSRLATDTLAGLVERGTQAEVDAGSDNFRYVTALTLANVPSFLKVDGTLPMSGTLDLNDNDLVFRDNGPSNLNYLSFDNGTKEYDLVEESTAGSAGNGTLNLGKLKSDEQEFTPAVDALVPATYEPIMRDNADNSIHAVTQAALGAALANQIMLTMYPVGTVYENTVSAVNPDVLIFGGTGLTTWVRYGDGRVTVGEGGYTDKNGVTETFSTGDDSTLGEFEHLLTEGEMPSHTHGTAASSGGAGSGGVFPLVVVKATGNTSSAGGNERHNNIQPYAVVTRWERTA